MKITMYYEDKFHPTVLEVPDEECSVMVETDYQQRLEAADDKSVIERRSVQEILNEEVNAPTFNKNRAETRRHIQMSAIDRELSDKSIDVVSEVLDKDYSELYQAIKKLRPQQQELVRRVFWEGLKQVEIARQDGVAENTVSDRMRRIYQRLKKFLPDQKNFL